MAITVEAMSPETLVELVNGWGSDPRSADGRSGTAYPPAAEITGRLAMAAGVGDTVTAEQLPRAADRLHRVFDTAQPRERARLVTELLDETGIRPALHMGPTDSPHLSWLVEQGPMVVLASAAVTLRDYLGKHGMGRIGVCTGNRCADVYIDASPAGRRRFCSVTCQNRARVAAFRSRRGAGGRGPRSMNA
ncbi:CGNR zinc finger domain-containing protein [Streptomyces tropicalis]|uniref:CGNR zinc finger domain-containing protein n=1 Tax=Streptomyces tropicalis TaxID=3034234 RepID=A0ABT6A4R9_9ACTN|nr:CGNR zinc finger domain-containing protein [Streptomyces tropicalis]MDF3299437.1 CGNR zinc finger domain-containing protein [Streptomyces tropicalis]